MKNIIFVFSFLMMCLTTIEIKSQTTSKKETKVQKCAVKVSFGSPGSGIDGKTYEAINALIKEKKLKHTEKAVGMEGETEMCLPLTELKKTQKTEFIKQLKNIASQGQFVSVSTN